MVKIFTPFVIGTPVVAGKTDRFEQYEGVILINDCEDGTVLIFGKDGNSTRWVDVDSVKPINDDIDWVREGEEVIVPGSPELAKCVGRAGKVVFLEMKPGNAIEAHTTDVLKGYGYKVKRCSPELPKRTLSMDEIAAKFNIPVDQLQIKKY